MLSEKNLINSQLDKCVPLKGGADSVLYEAVRYALLGDGKRFRPRLLIAAGRSLGAPLDDLLLPACAIEMIHTYSLIHDDLPCMDDDDMRRGKPSLHKAYPEWLALLAGDYLLTKAFELTAEVPAITRLFAEKSGGSGMIGGQVIDLLGNKEALFEMHTKKTAALIEAAFLAGGIIAGHKDLAPLSKAGIAFGLAYQLIDDIDDQKKESGKVNAALQFGTQETQKKAEALLAEALSLLETLPLQNAALIDIISSFAAKAGV